MSDVIYKPLIEDMTWSYSRIDSFINCKYAWWLKYIYEIKDDDKFFSSYGSFMHKILERYYRGVITKDEMLSEFLSDFHNEVLGKRPSSKIASSYIKQGIEYLESFNEFPFNTLDVERKFKFNVGNRKFVGVIDYIGEKDGDLYIVDNKSGNISPRSKRKKPTQKDIDLDKKLRQLYLYSIPVKEVYGKYPKSLCFNCFRTGVFIEEPFSEERLNETIEWVNSTINQIENEEQFEIDFDPFKCEWICGVNKECEIWNSYIENRRR